MERFSAKMRNTKWRTKIINAQGIYAFFRLIPTLSTNEYSLVHTPSVIGGMLMISSRYTRSNESIDERTPRYYSSAVYHLLSLMTEILLSRVKSYSSGSRK